MNETAAIFFLSAAASKIMCHGNLPPSFWFFPILFSELFLSLVPFSFLSVIRFFTLSICLGFRSSFLSCLYTITLSGIFPLTVVTKKPEKL